MLKEGMMEGRESQIGKVGDGDGHGAKSLDPDRRWDELSSPLVRIQNPESRHCAPQ